MRFRLIQGLHIIYSKIIKVGLLKSMPIHPVIHVKYITRVRCQPSDLTDSNPYKHRPLFDELSDVVINADRSLYIAGEGRGSILDTQQ